VTDYKLVAALATVRPLSRGSYPKPVAQPAAGTPDPSEVSRCCDCGEQRIRNSTKNQKKEANMSTEPTFQTEPEAPVVQPFRGRPTSADGGTVERPTISTRQGTPSLPDHRGHEQSETDKQEWKRDLDERKARTADQLAKRIEKPELTAEYFKAQVEELTANLENTVETYQASEGQPNISLISARERVSTLRAQLAEAERVLASEEQKGTLLDRFRAGVNIIESTLTGIVGRFSEFVANQIIVDRLGRVVPPERLGDSLKSEIRQHVRIHDLLQFYPARSAGVRDNDGAESLINRANIAFAKLQAFKQHIEREA
jgi:hypothetical protein